MRRLSLVALSFLAACGAPETQDEESSTAEAPAAAPAQSAPSPDDVAEPAPDASPQAAAAVLRRYFALAEAGRWDEAEALWWDDDRADAFAARLRSLGDFDPNIAAPGRIEGAAGSAYVSISLQLIRDSRSLSDGTAVLRRVNDVPGSTAEQRRWRIDRITLQPPPVAEPAAYRFVGRWAAEERMCADKAWVFTETSLETPAGSVCRFSNVRSVPGGFDIAARCTAEGPPTDDMLEIRFAESAKAMLFESRVIADAGLSRCEGD